MLQIISQNHELLVVNSQLDQAIWQFFKFRNKGRSVESFIGFR